jgi:hypothetical protein
MSRNIILTLDAIYLYFQVEMDHGADDTLADGIGPEGA